MWPVVAGSTNSANGYFRPFSDGESALYQSFRTAGADTPKVGPLNLIACHYTVGWALSIVASAGYGNIRGDHSVLNVRWAAKCE